MNKLTKTAKTLDTVVKVLQIITAIGVVASIIATLMLCAGLVFDIDPNKLGEVDFSIALDSHTFYLTEDAPLDIRQVWIFGAITTPISALNLALMYVFFKFVRNIFVPMKEGKPFHDTVTKNLKKLGFLSIIMCVVDTVTKLAVDLLTMFMFPVQEMMGEYVTGIDYIVEVKMEYLLLAGMCFLLSYIFDYGTQLQQLSDETL